MSFTFASLTQFSQRVHIEIVFIWELFCSFSILRYIRIELHIVDIYDIPFSTRGRCPPSPPVFDFKKNTSQYWEVFFCMWYITLYISSDSIHLLPPCPDLGISSGLPCEPPIPPPELFEPPDCWEDGSPSWFILNVFILSKVNNIL